MVLWSKLVLRAWGKDRLALSRLLGFDVGDPRTMSRIGVLMRDAWLMVSFEQVGSTHDAVLRFPFGCVGLGTRSTEGLHQALGEVVA